MDQRDYCPSPALPDGQVWVPKVHIATLFENLRWFLETKSGKTIPPDCPLGKAFALVADRFNSPQVPEIEKQYLIRLVQKFRFGDWSVNALFARHPDPTRHVDAVVHGHFIDGELFAADSRITQSEHFAWPSRHTRAVSAREYSQPLPGVSLSPCDFHRSVQAPEECVVARPPQEQGLPRPSRASSRRRLEAPGEDQTPRFWPCPRPAPRRAPWRFQAPARCRATNRRAADPGLQPRGCKVHSGTSCIHVARSDERAAECLRGEPEEAVLRWGPP